MRASSFYVSILRGSPLAAASDVGELAVWYDDVGHYQEPAPTPGLIPCGAERCDHEFTNEEALEMHRWLRHRA